jgi:hypothetical protein
VREGHGGEWRLSTLASLDTFLSDLPKEIAKIAQHGVAKLV